MSMWHTWAVLGCVAVLSSCTVGPTYRPPIPAVPTTWSEAQEGSVSTQPAPLTQWWSTFNDALLTTLITRAVASNLDLRLAMARVHEARAVRSVVAPDSQPQVAASGAYTRLRRSTNTVSLPTDPASASLANLLARDSDLFQIGFDARWELDLFGGVRRAVEAAEADIDAALAEYQTVLVTLLGEVARNYLELRGAQAQLAITRDNLAAQQDTLDLLRIRFQAGLSSDLDVARAEAQVATTASQIPAFGSQVRQAIHRLGVLLGQEPGTLLTALSSTAHLPPPPPEVAVGLPAELLQRRPDIRRAERALAAATARIGVAAADLYPRLALTGMLGLQSMQLADLPQTASQFWSFGPTIRWPIFDAGRIRANMRVQDARQEQALIRYEQTVLTALEDVENALVAYRQEQVRQRSLTAAVQAHQRAVALANELYTKGLADFLNVLEAQRLLLAAESQLAQSNTAQSSHAVALYKALGGGWEQQPERP
jgi:multidrug efflux system outer membrane protein